MADGIISKIQLPDNTIYDVVDNTSGYMTGMTILSYGSSTWQNFIDAYSSNKVVYCRASSNSNPASGSQTRLAFMAYVNNTTTPTEVEFQYYRSVSTHTASQQGDQVYVYKLNKTNGWSVTVREASVKVVAGTGLGGTYSNGTMTLTGPTKVSDLTNDSGFVTTDNKLEISSVSNGSYYPIVASNSTTAAIRQYDNTGFEYYVSNGTTSNAGFSELILGNNISVNNSGNKEGKIRLYGKYNGYADISLYTYSTNGRTITIPDASGTLALTSNINDAILTIQKNGVNVETFSANASSNKTANIVVNEVPSGGTTGQVLAKNSNTNYDAGWITLPDNGAFYVTFTYDDVNDSWSCDKTAQQIYEAYIVHKTILAKENVRNSLYYLDFIDYDGQEDYYNIKFTTQTGAESAQDGVYIYNSVFYDTSDDGIFQEDYGNDITNGVSDVKINNYSVVRDGVAYIPDMSKFVENFSSGDVTSFISPWVEEGFGLIRYRDQSFNEDHTASITYGVQRESNVSYSQIGLSADNVDLNGRTSFYNDNNSNYCVYLDVPTGLANAVAITLPSNNGTLALTSDLHNIPSGGTSGQVLTKHSATNYDVEWADASIGAYIVTFTYDESEDVYTCDKTSQEIYEACMSGKNIVGVCYYGDPITDGDIYDCKNVSKELEGGIYYYYAQFSSVSFEGGHAGSQILFVSNSGVRNDSDFMYPVPDNRKINNKPLSSDITLTASDVGALPDTTTIPSKTSDLTNDSGFITGYTETDPTVPAWAKASTKPSYNASEINGAMRVDGSYGNPPYSYGVYGLGSTATQIPVYYSTQNITDSNQVTTKGYVDNAISGKIDTAGTGLSKSGTTLNHSNSITAQTTSGIYPIKIDAQGHITEYGNAVTIPTITLNGSSTTSPSFYAPTGAGTSGYVLTSNGSGAPSWSNPTAAQIIRWAEST